MLKGCFDQKDEAWRSALHADLLATANNHFVAGASEECICIVGDCTKNEVSQVFYVYVEVNMVNQVSLVSAQQIVVGRQAGLPIPLSPLVAGMLDTLANTASYNLPANVVLNQLEVFTIFFHSNFSNIVLYQDNLQQLYLQSCILAEYLLSSEEFLNLDTISSVLGKHFFEFFNCFNTC